jgi:peptidyl-prolyl cis-trans isomerase C
MTARRSHRIFVNREAASVPRRVPLWFVLLGASILFWNSCAKKPSSETIVATVNGEPITLDDFIVSYETGPPLVGRRQGPDVAHLNSMVFEKLLAQEAKRLGLDQSPKVERAIRDLEEELVIEQVFEDEVQSKVILRDEEIDEAIKKSRVKLKVRYIFARTKEEIESLRQEILESGDFDSVQARVFARFGAGPEAGETGFFGWGDVPPEFDEVLYAMEIDGISPPVRSRQGYCLMKIADIRKTPFPVGTEYTAVRQKIEKILRARKSTELSAAFVKRIMDPLDVRVKRDAFNYVVDRVREIYGESDDDPSSESLLDSRRDVTELRQAESWGIRKGETLVTFGNDQWTIENFFQRFVPAKYGVRPDQHRSLRLDIRRAIGLMVRNKVLLEMGQRRNVHKRQEVQQEIAAWREKWAYEELKRTIADTIRITPSNLKAYFRAHADRYSVNGVTPSFGEVESRVRQDVLAAKLREILFRRANTLLQEGEIEVDYAILDSLPDWRQSGPPGMQFSVFKLGLPYFRPVAPTVDPGWSMLGTVLSADIRR